MCFNYAATGPAFAFEAAVDFLFLVDIVINFRTGILHEHISSMAKDQAEFTDYNHHTIATQYIKSWFFLDLISLVGLVEFMGADTSGGGSMLKMAKLLRFIKFSRLLKMSKLINDKDLLELIEEILSNGNIR